MEKKIENIIANKEYQDLSVEELMLVQDWATDEEAFYLTKQIVLSSKELATDQAPDAKIKEDLSAMFRAKYASNAKEKRTLFMRAYPQEKTFFMRPLVQVAALLFLLFLAYPLVNRNDFEQKQPTLAENDSPAIEKKREESTSQPKGTEKESKLNEYITESPEQMAEVTEPSVKAQMDTKDREMNRAEDMAIAPSAEKFSHTDKIYVNAILPAHRQIVQEKPQILDLLYTSF